MNLRSGAVSLAVGFHLDNAVSGNFAAGVAKSSRFGGFGTGRSSVAEGTIAVGTTDAAASQCLA